jgi:hypothetical protein
VTRAWIAALALALASPAGAITPEQAQTLPVGELARLVLGEAGALVVDVDRPKWPACDIMCSPPTEEQSRRPPPLGLGLTFYLSPTAASGMLDQWTGLCSVAMVGVSFDEQGRVTGIGQGRRWGVPNGLHRVGSKNPVKDFRARLASETEKCRSAADPRAFFVADAYETSAYRVVIAAKLFAEAAAKGGPLPFRLKCRSFADECGKHSAETVASRFRPEHIRMAMQVDCSKPDLSLQSIGPRGCYDVTLDTPGESLLLEVADGYSKLRIERVEYQHSTVVY